jgi:hypothetical protein
MVLLPLPEFFQEQIEVYKRVKIAIKKNDSERAAKSKKKNSTEPSTESGVLYNVTIFFFTYLSDDFI